MDRSWRQLVRWMVDEAPAPFEIMASPSRVAPGEPVSLRARVSTPFFTDVNDATVAVTVTSPTGTTQNVPLEWTLREDGTYAARFTPTDTGRYVLDAVATRGRDSVQTATSSLLVDERGADVAQAELRASLLRRIAEETGGRYYPLADAGKLTSYGWGFINSYNTERACGGDAGGGERRPDGRGSPLRRSRRGRERGGHRVRRPR